MKNLIFRLVLVICGNFMIMMIPLAQDDQIHWFAITGGAGVMNSLEHSVVSSIAQNFTGLSTLSDNRINSGFWNNQVPLATEAKDISASHSGFILSQNYPNPFSSTTTIGWQIPVASQVTLDVYNILGNKVKCLVNEYQSPGKYQVDFAAGNLSNGVYIIRFRAGEFLDSKIMNLLR
jgi:hypothetical protein